MEKRVYTLAQLSELVRGRVTGNGGVVITGIAGIKEASEGDITLAADTKYAEFLGSTRASGVVTTEGIACSLPSIVVDAPYVAFAKLLELFAVTTDIDQGEGIHPTTVIDPTAKLGAGVRIGAYCRIGRDVRIGDGTRLLFGIFVGDRVTIGERSLIYPNVTIREASEIGNRVILHPGAVIGADGFGFTWDGERHVKIPQIGRVVIEDDVEIGANSAVDRATTGATRICRGTKIDNLVQIAHNCVVGKHTILAGQVGISGSTELGERVIAGGQAGLGGHLKIGDGVVIGGQAGVTKSIPSGTTVSGYPAREHGLARKLYAYWARLPELFARLKSVEARLAKLEKGTTHGETTDDDR